MRRNVDYNISDAHEKTNVIFVIESNDIVNGINENSTYLFQLSAK